MNETDNKLTLSEEMISRVLDNLTTDEKAEVIKILDEYAKTGNLDLLKSFIKADYDEDPVDIKTFITNKDYLGSSLMDDNGNLSVYPFWVEQLEEIFGGGNSKYSEIIFTGGIGLGKSTIAVIGMSYILHRLLCLRSPQEFYRLPPNSKIVFCLFNITLDLAEGVAFAKFNDLLINSPWFMKHGTKKGKTKVRYVPSKNIEIITGSRASHGLGRDIFCLSGETKVKVGGKSGVEYIPLQSFGYEDTVQQVFGYDLVKNKVVKDNTKRGAIPTKKVVELVKITLEDGTVIEGSDNHKMLMEDGTFKELSEIKVGDSLKEVRK